MSPFLDLLWNIKPSQRAVGIKQHAYERDPSRRATNLIELL